MNPFKLPGPSFLLLYVAVGIALIVGARLWLRWRDRGPLPRLDLSDPYLIALLAKGNHHAARVAVLVCLQRRWLRNDEGTVHRDESPVGYVREVELSLLEAVPERGIALEALVIQVAESSTVAARTAELERLDLLASGAVRARRRGVAATLGLFLVTVASSKIAVAVQSGHKNIAFLVVLMLALLLVTYIALIIPRRTALGDRALVATRRLVSGLDVRNGAAEVPLFVAAHATLPDGVRDEPWFQSSGLDVVSWNADTGITCGSSGGSGCSGGGGCGGGCGGCGS